MDPFIGEIRMFAGNFAPRGWAFCSGQILSIAQNTALFSLLGTTYGGNGQTTFALPDLRGRVSMGQGQGPGLSNRTLGEQTGEAAHTLLVNEIPQHNHAQQASTNAATAASGPSAALGNSATQIYGGAPSVAMAATAVDVSGGSQPHENMAPYGVLNFIIALEGIFPARN
jgi:microcystin-dependent protein